MELILLYDLTWKDIIHVLGQMLTPDLRAQVLGEAITFGDEWLGGKGKEGSQNSPPPYWETSSSHSRARLGL